MYLALCVAVTIDGVNDASEVIVSQIEIICLSLSKFIEYYWGISVNIPL